MILLPFRIYHHHLLGIKQLNKLFEEDILNYSPTVMFRGTPCMYKSLCLKCPRFTPFTPDIVGIVRLH